MGRAKLSELQKEECELSMTPMIDVTFLLLIFFMCTLKFKTLEGKLAAYLPKDVGVNQDDAEPIEKVEILVRVKEVGAKLKPGRPPHLYEAGDTGRFQWNTPDLAAKWPELRKYPIRSLEYKVGPSSTRDLNDLEDKLRRTYTERSKAMIDGKEVPATIDARPGTVYEDVADVLDTAIKAGFKEITFVGAFPDHIK